MVMTWELLQRGRSQLLLGILGANAMPVFLFAALRMERGFDPADPSFVTVQLTLLQLVLFCLVAAILSVREQTSRAYTLPVSTAMLVAWRMAPAMVLISLETLASIAALNAAFGLDWPLLGPALLAPVALAMTQATLWFSEKSSLLTLNIGITGSIIGLWYKSRYGAIFSMPSHAWVTVTPVEMATLLMFAIASYFVAVAGVARNRCGEKLTTRGAVAWLEWVFDLRTETIGYLLLSRLEATNNAMLRSPTDTQFVSEWQRKGWLLPGVVAFGGSVAALIWLVFSRSPVELVEGMIGGGMILSLAGILGGLVVGNCGFSDSSSEMGHFLATRPLTDRQLAATLLKVAAWTVLISWAVWVVPSAIVAGLLAVTGNPPQSLMITQLQWWYLPVTLLGCWITVSVSASCIATGRAVLPATLFALFIVAAVALLLVAKSLDRESQARMYSVIRIVCGLGFGCLTLFGMIAARRRSLIAARVLAIAGCVWLGICAVIVAECLRVSYSVVSSIATASTIVLLIGVAALSVAPLALAPLAIAWNRHR
jgi:hypothetical protein